MRNVLSIILGGGRGKRLYPLTKLRAKPAVAKGKFVKGISLSSTMGPGLKVDEAALQVVEV